VIANPPVELTDLSQVERALAESRASGPGSVRATTLNLVVYAPTPADVAFTQRAVERIGGSRPLRAIIAGVGANGVRASVSASCWLGSGLQHVCSEQVVLTARAGALPSAVLSLLVPDLPTFVWWQGPMPADRALLSALAVLGTSTIVDSNSSSLEGVEEVGRLEPAVTDLAWLRLGPWRGGVASRNASPGDEVAGFSVTSRPLSKSSSSDSSGRREWRCSQNALCSRTKRLSRMASPIQSAPATPR